MTESSHRLKRSSRAGIAAVSTIALALGGISVVGPGPLAPHAAAATLSGGIRDKSGAVEKDAQQPSDLPAGSCVVKSEESSGSQAGFSWDHLEPGGGSPSKTLWGLSVAFDNSKDRTFADWNFTNTGSLGTVLNTGTVPSMEAGTDFPVKPPLPVTAKADESIDITTSGRGVLRNLNLYAELTDEKVKQFASASADNPVRYAWQSNYKQDNDKGPAKATEGGSASFGATVNPWPSENIECNPIKVSWGTAEVSENHVIVPGEETKVGTINVPALQNGGTDDSMSRMVVEAYDGNGKFIGTTDPEASGGEQLLRIDEATGDIYFTWPEYRGTDLATDKNVNFSVLAKPRTVGQLQAATEHNTEGGNGKAFDSSNSLTRYNTANVIDSTSFSLDDTEYHDPKYDKTDASIISGVDSATGPLATEPQKVTFTQTPDLIKELAKKKDQQGFEAKATLDEKYVYEGWTVEMDEDYNVTVTAPENPRPGTFARPKVIVEYSNGSTDELELLVVVDPNNTQVTDLVRPGLTKGTIGDDLTAQIGTKSIMKGHKPVHPAKFEVDPSTVPAGWTVTVDATGKVTAKADDTVAPGTIITPTVKATYPDQTTDEIETQFQAIVDIKIPDYDTVTNKPNSDVTLTPEIPELGLSGNTTDEAPNRYTFEDGTTTLIQTDDSGTWTLKIDENTGVITTTIPKTAPEGYVLNVPVLAHYEKEKPQKVKGTIVVIKGDLAPVYSVETTGPGQAVNHQIADAPKGSTFSFGKNGEEPILRQEVNGWTYTIDPTTGVVSSTPPADAKPGDKNTATVRVETQDGSVAQVPVTTVVKLTNSWEAEPAYPVETVYPGDTATLPVTLNKPDSVKVAANNPYELGAVPPGWTVSIDNDGKVTATAPADAVPGSTVEIPVTVTYEDGSKDTAKAVVNVVDVPTRPVPFGVEYVYDDTIPAGEYKTVTKGVAGEEKQQRDGTWEQTTAPTNEVVHIGTKPAEASKDVTWTAPIPYSTTTRPNPALAPGETKVVQQGVNGERTYTAKFTATGDQASVVESEDTKQPVEEIIEYGPRLDDQELVTETTRKIPFETTIVYDNTLEAGTQVVDTQGVVGEETVTSTQKLVDGKPSGDPVVTTTTVTEKQDAVIRVGTKTEGANTVEHTEPVPYETKVEYDPNMPAGTYEVVTPGKAGEKTVKVTQTIVNSKVTDTKREENVTTQPVTEVIKVGTKQATATDKVEWTEPIPFSTVVRPNPDLKPGEVNTVQEGKNGEAKYTATFEGTNGQATVTESKERTEPTDRIIEYGPTIADQTLTSTTTNPVPFNTTFVADPNLPAGEQVVVKQGENGVDTITSTQEIKDGKPVGEPKITTERTKEPVDAVVRVGTKTEGQTTKTVEADVPFGVKVEFDPNMPAGTSETVTEGEPGKKTITVTQKVTNSQPDGEATVEEKITKQPVDQVIKVGTKPSEASANVTWTAPVPFEVETRPNSELKPGEINVVQKGVPGEKTYTADFAAKGSDATVTPKEEQTKAPVKEIIEYGPRLDDQNLVTTVKKPVPFETEIVFDDTLASGTQEVKQYGRVGEDTVTSTQKLVDGQPSGDPVVETERTADPIKQIIRVGTKTTGTNTETFTTEAPYKVVVKYDPNMPAGTSEVTTTGVPGEKTVTIKRDITNSQPGEPTISEEITKEPVDEVITVGTKQATATDSVQWTEPIPFSTTLRPNPELKPGETRVVQEGKNGEASYVAVFSGTNGEATVKETKARTEPVERIVEYGPRAEDTSVVTKTEKPVPFETEIVFDDTLAAGEQVVDKQGELGTEVVTSTQNIVDGKPTGEPTVTTERTKEPVNAVVRVGTKTEGQTVNSYEAEIPFPTRIVYDPSLKPGESKVTQEGKPGTKKVTITQPVVNSAPNGEATVAEETVTEPTEQIVTVGTKPDQASNKTTWVAPLPYDTIVRPNPELKPGEIKTVQKGEFGKKKFTADFSATGGNSTVSTVEEVTKDPVQQIIEYGPTIDDQTLKSETTRPIEFETEFILDDTLPAGEQKVDQQGENGEEKITSTQEIKDGKPVGEPTITTEVTKPAKKAIIRVGTKPSTTTATTTETTTAPTTVPTTVTETVTATVTSIVEVPGQVTTITPTPETKVVTTTATPDPETKVVPTTITEQGEPITTTVTKEITKDPETTVVTTTEHGEPIVTTFTETQDPITTTIEVPVKDVEVQVHGSTVQVWAKKNVPFAVQLRDTNIEPGSLKFTNGATTMRVDEGEWKVNPVTGELSFTPNKDFVGEVTPVELTYTRTDGAKVVTPIRAEAFYNDCGCSTPTPEEPSDSESPDPSDDATTTEDTSEPGEPSEPSSSPTTGGSAPATVTVTETLKPVPTTVNGTPTTVTVTETPEKPEPSTVVTTVDGAPTTVTVTEKPGVTTVTETTTVKGNAGAEAKAVIDRCFGNAVRSPLLYLLPLGILAQVGGKIVQPYIASYQAQLDAFNAEINRQIQEQYQLPDFGAEIGKHVPRNQQIDELIARVNEANGQLQQLAAQPEVQQLGKAAGVILATVAAGAVLYDWCSNEPGKAFTAVGEKGDDAGKRLGRGESSSR